MALSRSRLLASFAAAAALAGFVAAVSPAAQAVPKAHASIGRRHPGAAHAEGRDRRRIGRQDEKKAGLAKPRDAYYWSPLLTNNPRAVGSPHQPSIEGTPGSCAPEHGRRQLERRRPEPDRAGRPHDQHLRGGVRPHRRAGDPPGRHAHPRRRRRAACGPTTAAAARGRSACPTRTPRPSARSPWQPNNDNVVYMGSGEGALSGDSQYGDGIYRSSDGGVTWPHVSHLFAGQSVSDTRGRPDQLAAPVRVDRPRPRR